MTLYQVKPAFQALLRPLMFWLYRQRIVANHVTLAALALSAIAGAMLFFFPRPGLFMLLPIVLFIRMALNALDGMLARECGQQSRAGAILNEAGDVISDIALYLPFIMLPESSAALVLVMLFCAMMTEFCGVLAQTVGGTRSYAGPLGKSDRALLFGAWALGLALWPPLCGWNNIVWGAATALLIWTAINRCRSALRPEAVK
ncbi:CDP-alcohol phosphatidyltransferase family protein [Intestinirhabdus alba]|jgi:phosphatidylglycerophosphate synthase|uniref:CDP-alcohol phosphatidyltransferase family protein n=1 Tax=Intestinirhabdus alba TaxID=2899544 RepID=A0A6L6IUI8_9ENTR|nr:CDP-alcohol phosphatidyltransferase family protein [Intestinirhabdus alba]MTH48403.1 CDP-alcohol phosphatidyltransferase family protein [Intestinirhabdus alba]